jgi:hypothetical protein
MKEQMLLRPHLLNKFDELPVNGNGVADWKKMEKALQIAMPIGLLSFVLFGKGWLLSKKLMWLWISIVTCGGAATTLAVYQSRQASLTPASPSINKPNRGNIASHVIAAVNDTTIRVSKKKTQKISRKMVGTSVIKVKTITLNDTVVRPLRKLRPVRVVRDTLVRSFKMAGPLRVVRDTLVRSFKMAGPLRVVRDTTLVGSFKMAGPLRVVRDTLVHSFKMAGPLRVVRDTLVRSFKMAGPLRVVRDTLVRPVKKLNAKPVNP